MLAGTSWLREAGGMAAEPATYPGYRFPAEVIRHAVWLYHVFSLSLRDVELILAERGVIVTHESIRLWCRRFGTDFACRLRRRRPRPGDTWHLDEMYLRINGMLHYLWRAADQHGVVLDILVQARRNATAAKRFFKRLLVGLNDEPKRIVTDGLCSYGVAKREVLADVRPPSPTVPPSRAIPAVTLALVIPPLAAVLAAVVVAADAPPVPALVLPWIGSALP